MSNINYINISNQRVKSIFEQAVAGFPSLQNHRIDLIEKPIPKTIMRAQPYLNFNFFWQANRDYKVEMSSNFNLVEEFSLSDLPDEVLLGWFAHELGHVVDYQKRSAWNMIGFVIGYLFFPTFKMGVERRADVFAIEAGFAKAITATKTFILHHSTLSDQYKSRIRKYYMSVEEVSLLSQKEEELELDNVL